MTKELIHKSAGTALSQAEFEATDEHQIVDQATDDIIVATSASQLSGLNIPASRIVGKRSTGNVAALTPAEANVLLGPPLVARVYASDAPLKPAATDAANLVWVCDGTADQTEINAALAAAQTAELSKGTFYLSEEISALSTGAALRGSGRSVTNIYQTDVTKSHIKLPAAAGVNNVCLEDFSLHYSHVADELTITANAIDTLAATSVCYGWVINNIETNYTGSAAYALAIGYFLDWKVSGFTAHQCGGGIYGYNPGTGHTGDSVFEKIFISHDGRTATLPWLYFNSTSTGYINLINFLGVELHADGSFDTGRYGMEFVRCQLVNFYGLHAELLDAAMDKWASFDANCKDIYINESTAYINGASADLALSPTVSYTVGVALINCSLSRVSVTSNNKNNILTDCSGYTLTGLATVDNPRNTMPIVAKVFASNAPFKPLGSETSRYTYLCDGTADEDDVRAAITAGATHIILSAGDFSWSGAKSVEIPSNTVIEGQGWSTVITQAAGAAGVPIFTNSDIVSGNSNIVVRDMKIDGNKANVTGDTWTPAVEFWYVNNGEVSNIYATSCKSNQGFAVARRGAGVSLYGCTYISVHHNYFTDSLCGVSVRGGCTYISVTDNYSWTHEYEGIKVGAIDAEVTPNSSITISRNFIWDCDETNGAGIDCSNGASAATLFTITDNNVQNCYHGILLTCDTTANWSGSVISNNVVNTTNGGSGISVAYLNSVVVSGNSIATTKTHGISISNSSFGSCSENVIVSAGWDGISIGSSYIDVVGNNITASGTISATGTGYGIETTSGGLYCTITGNTITNGYAHATKFGGANGNINGNCVAVGNANVSGIWLVGADCTASYNYVLDPYDHLNTGTPLVTNPNTADRSKFIGNTCRSAYAPTGGFATLLTLYTRADNCAVLDNDFVKAARAMTISNSSVGTVLRGNIGFIAPGEIRMHKGGTITGAAASNVLATFQNPFAQNVLVKDVVIYVTAADGDAPNIDVGIDGDGAGAPDGAALFTDLTGETTGVYSSLSAGLGGDACGVQIAPVVLSSNAGANDWIVMYNDATADATSFAGTWYITLMGI